MFMTLAELDRSVVEARWGEARRLRFWRVSGTLQCCRTAAICAKWAVAAQTCGRRIDCTDGWIAATALLTGAPPIAPNRDDYPGVPGLAAISYGQ